MKTQKFYYHGARLCLLLSFKGARKLKAIRRLNFL